MRNNDYSIRFVVEMFCVSQAHDSIEKISLISPFQKGGGRAQNSSPSQCSIGFYVCTVTDFLLGASSM
jgi:hypothetical protein